MGALALVALPDGTLRIQGFEDWLLRDAVGAPTEGRRPHAAWRIMGGFRGMGAGVDGRFELIGDVVVGTAEVAAELAEGEEGG